MVDVFISYKSEERDLVAPIAKQLGALGLNVWFDQKFVLANAGMPQSTNN